MARRKLLALLALMGAGAFLGTWAGDLLGLPGGNNLIVKTTAIYIFVSLPCVAWIVGRAINQLQRRYSVHLDLLHEQLERAESENKALVLGNHSAIQNSDAAMVRIRGNSFMRLQRAIKAFPDKYPEYEKRTPKLDGDVRQWLHDSEFVRDGAKGREAIVFGRIISEHFGFSPDTQKSQKRQGLAA